MAVWPDQCWTLERVPRAMEPGPAFILKNNVDIVRIGRRVGANKDGFVNDKVCNGINVSRDHLHLVRTGDPVDWQTVRWSVKDLGGMCGTYVNMVKIQANTEITLNCGEKIGLGCPNGSSYIGDVDGVERFVYMIKSPQAYRLQVPALADVMEQDAPTPPPVDVPEEVVDEDVADSNLPDLVTASSRQSLQEDVPLVQPPPQPQPASGSSRPPEEPRDSPIPRPRTRKRSRHLMSSSDEDTEDVKTVKENFKKMKKTETDATKPLLPFLHNLGNLDKMLPRKCSCRLPLLRLPSRAVGARVSSNSKIIKWRIVGIEEYKRWSRKTEGLAEDGSQGTPLLVEMTSSDPGVKDRDIVSEVPKDVSEEGEILDEDDGLSIVDSDEDFSRDNIIDKPLETSPVSSDDEEGNTKTEEDTIGRVKQEPRESPGLNNYSLLEDVITILDSDDEEGYNQSQNVGLDQDDVGGSRLDSPTFSEAEMSSDPLEDDMEEDEDEIQILNESQTPLFAKILKASNIKAEPKVLNVEEEEESQSLLASIFTDNTNDNLDEVMIKDVVTAVDGANESLVRKVYKRLLDEGKSPDLNDILPEVVVEVERKLIIKMSLAHGIPMKTVEVIVVNMKGDDQENIIIEEDLDLAIRDKKREEDLVEKFKNGSLFSNDIIKEAVLKLKQRNTKLTEETLMTALAELNERQFIVASLADKLKLTEAEIERAIEKVLSKDGDLSEEAVEKALQKRKDANDDDMLLNKSKELAQIFNTSIEEARESLTLHDFDEDKAFMALQNLQDNNKSKESKLSETFNISLEEAKEALGRHGGDLEAASQDHQLIRNLEIGAVKDTEEELIKTKLPRSSSPNLLDDSDSIDDLLKDDDDDVIEDTNFNTPAAKKEPVKSKTTSEFTKSKLIDPLPLPKRRGIFTSTDENLASKKVASTSSKKPSITEPRRGAVNKPEVSFRPKPSITKPQDSGKKKSKEEIAEERKQRLKSLAEKQLMKKVEKTKVDEAPAAGVMKTSVPKNQRLLMEMEKSEAGPSSSRKRHTSNKEFSRPKVPSPPSKTGFLESEVKKDKEKLTKKEKYASTVDGFKTVKKMSCDNVDYSVMSQDISKKPMPNVKPFQLTGIDKDIAVLSKKMKSVRWRDESGFEPLVDTRYIAAANQGVKCGPGNKDLMMVEPKGGVGSKRKPPEAIVVMNNVFKTILEWKVGWLDEQKQIKEPPPVHGQYQLLPLPSSFSNDKEYVQIFLPLMFHELWSSISDDYENRPLDPVQVCIQEITKEKMTGHHFTIIRCIALLTEKESLSDLSAEGTFIKLDLSYNLASRKDGKVAREIKPCFGYVQQVSKDRLMEIGCYGEVDRDRIMMLIKGAEKQAEKQGSRVKSLTQLVTFTLKCKANVFSVEKHPSAERPIYLRVLSRVKPELRKFEALLGFSSSPLHKAIITPQQKTFQTGLGTEHLHASIKDIPSLSRLNAVQKRSIVSVGRSCLSDPDKPSISLIQGPPGTGKSSTIVGIVCQILFASLKNNSKETFPRILVVAPSNAAVDEVARKLITASKHLPETLTKFRMIRLGVRAAMHPEVQKYSLEDNIRRIVEEDTNREKASESLKRDVEAKQKSANILFDQKQEAEGQGNADMAAKLHRDWLELQQQIKKVKGELAKPLDGKKSKELRRRAEDVTMAGADVILTTLSSSVSREMEKLFIQGITSIRSREAMRSVSVCVMDEASQCVEPEALIPFKLGFKKLVMVGDHEQLQATVTSQKAKYLQYQQSLFGRLNSFLTTGGYDTGQSSAGNTPPMMSTKSPVLRLETQYRMHPEIANWPNRYFYGGLLRNGELKAEGKLVPFMFLNVESKAVMEKGNCFNKEEEKVIIQLVKTIKEIHGKTPNMGIITFYAKQKQNISLELQNQKLDSSRIAVNTVDGFQGSEKDIVLISCVRAGGEGLGFLQDKKRLNVALTRAKKTLIVVGNANTLRSSRMWENFIENARERKMQSNYSDISKCLSKVLKCDTK